MPITVNGLSAILADGIWETTQTTGTGTYSLDGPVTSDSIVYRTFVAGVGTGNPTVYLVRSGSQFEIGIGTVTSGAPATLTRSSILKSSNSNLAVSWGSGIKDILIAPVADLFHSMQAQIDNMITRVKTTTFTASGTFTTDSDCIVALVRIVGGGGGGGGTVSPLTGQSAEGGGGGGGEYAEGYFTVAQLGASKTVTIGSGGTAGTSGGGNGGAGGATNFGAGLLTANGGAGGAGGPSNVTDNPIGGNGGFGGTGGFVRIVGSEGGRGTVRQGIRGLTCRGGASFLSGECSVTDVGQTGKPYGGGGSGASSFALEPARTGGIGAAGVCIVVEHCKA